MNQPALQYKPLRTTLIEPTPADELAEGLYKTFWKGSSQVDFRYLLDIAENVPLEVIQGAPEDEIYTLSPVKEITIDLLDTIDLKIPDISERVDTILSEIPFESHESPHQEVFQALQEWEGFVQNIDNDTFSARLLDITNKENPEEEGDFLIEDLRNDDIKMLKPGAVFSWVIGYVIKRDGTKRRSSDIVFRRLPQWTQNDITEADKEAKKLFGEIDWQ